MLINVSLFITHFFELKLNYELKFLLNTIIFINPDFFYIEIFSKPTI
jgi:hypothetical protein